MQPDKPKPRGPGPSSGWNRAKKAYVRNLSSEPEKSWSDWLNFGFSNTSIRNYMSDNYYRNENIKSA